ncbi:TPA: choice-of-anchor D domain-containing protein, partial [bacterium]|nr:choice-of-anchor D domain-containing protein [bacterium]
MGGVLMYKDDINLRQGLIIPILFILMFIFSINNSYGDSIVSFNRPAKIVIVSGDIQSGISGQMLPEPLVIKLLDKNNMPSTFWNVTFKVIAGGGKVSWNYIKPATEIKVATNSQGIASANLTVGDTKAVNQVRAFFEDLTPVTFIATVGNTAPVLQPIGNKEVNEGASLKIKVSATDVNIDDVLTFSTSTLPANSTFDPVTGIFTFNPNYTQAGVYNITFKVSDGFAEDSELVTITVKNVNQPPVLNPIGSRSVDEGNELAILVSANDPDGDVLIYSVLNIPTGATFDPSTRIFRWKPGFNVAPNGGFRNFNVIFMVKDPFGLSDTEEIIITVNDVQPLVPDIRVLPITFDNMPSLDFGITDVGNSSDRIFQIHNDGNENLNIANIKTSDGQFKFISYLKANSAPIDAIDPLVLQLLDENTIISYLNINSNFVPVTYSQQNTLMSINYPIIEPGKCLLIKAQFKPITIGLKQANFTIESNDPDEAIVIMKVRGTAMQAPEIRVSTNNIDFGNIQLGTSLTIPLTIYNDGNGALTINSITIDDTQFTVSQYSEVSPSSSITVNVKFTPTSVGEKTSTLRISSNDPDEAIVLVTLKGNAFRLPTPEISVTPTSISFGDVDVGKSLTKTFQINNTGDAILNISSITSSNNQFVVLNSSNVPVGSQVTISVRFTPATAGAKAGLLTINSNDLDEPAVVVSVQGTGVVVPQPNIRVSPTSIDFGDVVLGESLIKYLNIYNDGSAVLQITSITSNNNRFTILDNSTGIYSGGVVQIRVKFEPQVLGSVSGFITIASNDPDEPSKQIAIKGKGINPPFALIRLLPTSLDFGQVQVTKSLTKEYRIYNDGTTTLNITNITSNNDQFIPIFINTLSIAPNNYVIATVRFAPGSVGLKTGTVNIFSNDPNNPTKALPVQGTGFVTNVPDIAVMPMSLDFGEVEINQTIVSGFYIYNNGNALLQISSITSNNTQFSIITSTTSIEPDYMAPVAVRFSPNSIGTKSGKITILSNDPDHPSVEVMVYGDGIYPGLPAIGVWKQIKQTGILNDLNDVFFTDSNRGWIAGYDGTILYSSNAGESWLPQFSGTSRSLDGIFFTDNSNGWAVGQYGTALRTFNGGNNWSFLNMNINNSLKSIVFTELSRAWAVGDSGTVMRYNGSSWTRQTSNTSFDLMDVDFVNSSQGWAVGGFGTIIRTVDGGQNWLTQLSNTSYALNGVDFVNSYEGWAVGSGGIILHTQNGGQTWSPQTSNANFNTLTDVFFLNSVTGWAVGWNGTILYTANGGQNWVRIDSGVTENLHAVYFISPDQGWIVGANGTILRYVPGLPSSITSVSVAGSPANSGGSITITAVGQSRNTAKFSIAGVVSNVSMIENPPGTYTGVYNIPQDSTINITDATVIVTLTNKYGQIATNTSQKVTIDTVSMIESAGVTPNMLKAGDTVIVTASGESGGVVRFTIEGVISDVYMTETPYTSGKYIGEYRIPQGTNATNAKVTVKLTDKLGNSATKEAGFVTIDTVAQIGAISITGSPAGLGKTITVTMTGEAKGTARFGIKDLVASVLMTETSTGVYTGNYTAKQGDNVKNALVTVSLIDALGNTATKDGGYVTADALCIIDLSTISGSPGRAGGSIKVDIVGDPNGSAKFSIDGIAGENALVESPVGSGKYTGNYIIPANINVTNAVVTITLVDAFGNIALDTSKKVTIDNIVPEITSVEILGSPGRVGGKITVSIIGEPNAKAKFRIENIADENMQEQPIGSGKYTGSYSVLSGINVQDAIVT